MIFIGFVYKLVHKILLHCKSLIMQSSFGVKKQNILFYIDFYGKNCFGFRTFRFSNGFYERITFKNRDNTVQQRSKIIPLKRVK